MRLQSEPVSLSVGGSHLQIPNSLRLSHIYNSYPKFYPTARGELSPNPSNAIQPSHPLSGCGCTTLYPITAVSDLSYPYQPFTGG